MTDQTPTPLPLGFKAPPHASLHAAALDMLLTLGTAERVLAEHLVRHHDEEIRFLKVLVGMAIEKAYGLRPVDGTDGTDAARQPARTEGLTP